MTWFSLQAQNEKLRIAIFDPTSSGATIDEGTRIAVREIISSIFVNTGNYTIVERSLIERVMQEQKFSNSGAVDDSHASEIGRLAGANKIVLSVIAQAGNNTMLSIKLVDVNSASVEKQKTQVIAIRRLLDFVEPMTMEIIKEVAADHAIFNQPAEQIVEQPVIIAQPDPVEQPLISDQPFPVEPEEENIQDNITTVAPNEFIPQIIETKPEILSIQKGTSKKSTTFISLGVISIAAGAAATILLPNEYEEYGYAKLIKGKEYNLIYAGAGLAIGSICIGKGIRIKKKEKAQTQRLDLVATGYGAGFRLTF